MSLIWFMFNFYVSLHNFFFLFSLTSDVPLAKDSDSQADTFMPRDWPESKISDLHGIGKLTTRYRRTVVVGIKYLVKWIIIIRRIIIIIKEKRKKIDNTKAFRCQCECSYVNFYLVIISSQIVGCNKMRETVSKVEL